MKREFTVRFQEIVCYRVTVTADTEQDAIAEARRQFEDGEHVKEVAADLDHFEASETTTTQPQP